VTTGVRGGIRLIGLVDVDRTDSVKLKEGGTKLEQLLAGQEMLTGRVEAKIEASDETFEVLGSVQKKVSKMDGYQGKMKANMNAWREGNQACLQKMEACLERQEPFVVEMVKMMTNPETGVCSLLADR
jgi:hypothetical protein